MANFWKNKTILVTGGAGFLGSHVTEKIEKLSPKKIIIPRSKTDDLRKQNVCQRLVQGVDVVIHLAANVGGIGYNQKYPGTLFYDNIMMGIQLMEEARKAKVDKFVVLGTICAYPKYTPIPFQESELWSGYPEETNAPYGLAKKMSLVQAQAYRQQFDFNVVYLLPVNMYGPRDNFDEASSHVIPALIKKFYQAKLNNDQQVTVWGTGKPTREFLYVEDAAEAIILATEKYNKPDPINIGASFEISIADLAQKIKSIVGFQGKICFDNSKPDGQPRRKLDVSKAQKEFGFQATTNFDQGLRDTILWYKRNLPDSSV